MINYLYQNLLCKHESTLIKKYEGERRLSVQRQKWRCVACGKEWPLDYLSKFSTEKTIDNRQREW